ncbi:large ribosomal subunit protein uL13m-like [Styela clava]
MSYGRANQQWSTFSRMWYIINAYKQPPGKIASITARYLEGRHKPIYHPMSDCGDHVVIVNTKEIAYAGNKWEQKVFSSHTGRKKGFLQMQAYVIHGLDPTWIVRKAVYSALPKTSMKHRRGMFTRAHFFEDENVPDYILQNIVGEIQAPRRIPKSIQEYSEEEIKNFPRLWIPPPDLILD